MVGGEGPSVSGSAGGGGGGATGDGRTPGMIKPSGTFTFPGAGLAGAFSSLSSNTLPNCTFFFFPSSNSSSVFRRLVLPWSLVARSLLNPEVLSPLVSPLDPTRNCTARMFSIPGFTVMRVRESPIFLVATGTAFAAESVVSVAAAGTLVVWDQLGLFGAAVAMELPPAPMLGLFGAAVAMELVLVVVVTPTF